MTYFIRIRGKAFGPFDEEQLLNMKSQGKLGKTTEVSENRTDWQPAESLDFLYHKPDPKLDQKDTGSGGGIGGSQIYLPQAAQEPAEWNYSVNGTEGFGPVTAAAIEQMLRSGHLTGNSYVWQQGQNARLIKNEPRFSDFVGGKIRRKKKDDSGNIVVTGEITGTSEMVDTGEMLQPIAASLGWLMFLKITFLLVGVVADGLALLWWSVFSISNALGLGDAIVLMVILITIGFWAGLYALRLKTFLCFWKFHTVLNQTVATGKSSDLIAANQKQFLFWKWLSITVIAYLSVFVISVTATIIAWGWILGLIGRFSPPF